LREAFCFSESGRLARTRGTTTTLRSRKRFLVLSSIFVLPPSRSAFPPAVCSRAPKRSRRHGRAAIYGGTAGVAYDQLCDTISNVNTTAIDQMADATAHATLIFAMTDSAISGTDKSKAMGESEFRGSQRQK
jgi:hypothetical protein